MAQRIPILVLVGLSAVGCVHPIERALRSDSEVVVTYEEREAVLGAIQIRIDPDRTLTVRRWRPEFFQSSENPELELQRNDAPLDRDQADVVETGSISVDERARLDALVLDLEAWEQVSQDGRARIEGSRARLTLETPGARSEVWEWAQDLQANERLARVKAMLEALVTLRARPETQ